MFDRLRQIACGIRGGAGWLWENLSPIRENALSGVVRDLFRSREDLVRENAFLRHQLVVLGRSVKRPKLTTLDRVALLAGAAVVPRWRQALAIVQPDTILRWHRAAFRLFWKWKTKSVGKRRLAAETVSLIRRMVAANRTWGAERIRGELLKLGIHVAKRTIQRYIRSLWRRPGGQRWATFLRNQADAIWSCDFVQTYDLLFRPVFAFFIIHQGSRRVVLQATTKHPTEEWTAQQLRNALMDEAAPKFLIRDRDSKFGAAFDRVAKGSGTRVIKTAVKVPDMNAVVERFLRSVRAEALDHMIIVDELHLYRVLREYVAFFNEARPHQGIEQRIPSGKAMQPEAEGRIIAFPVLGGLHHDYRRAA